MCSSERSLGIAGLTATFRPRALAGAAVRFDPVDHFEESARTRFDNVRADARASIRAPIVLHVHDRLALGVLTLRNAVHLELAQFHREAGRALDGLEARIDRTIAAGFLADPAPVRVSELDRRLRAAVAAR